MLFLIREVLFNIKILMLVYTFPEKFGGIQKKYLVWRGLLINGNRWQFLLQFGVAPPPYTIRLSRVGGSFLEIMCSHTVMAQMPWSAKYKNQNFEKTFPFYKAYKNNLKKCQRIFTFKMYPNQVIAISVIQNPGGTQKQNFF